MNAMTDIQKVFLLLIRLGLWEKKQGGLSQDDIRLLDKMKDEEWDAVMDLANLQTSMGIVTDALTFLPAELRPSKKIYLNAISQTSDIEDANKRMNDFALVLMEKLKQKDVNSRLLKGQGVAMCYFRPYHRQSGDIDLLILDDQQFLKGCRLMEIISNSSKWDEKSSHAEFQAMGFVVELHGKYSFIINRKVTDRLIEWNAKRNQEVRVEQGLILPSLQFDAVFIFTHMLNHFMTGGVGLRQISDWMMFVNAYFDKLDMKVLEDDLNFLGIMKFWQAFASLAVMQLGFPEKKMPFYDARWNRKADTLMDAIFKTGNFGALQKAKQLSKDTNKWVKKLHTAFGQFPVYWRVGKIFPAEAVYCFLKYSKWQIFGR